MKPTMPLAFLLANFVYVYVAHADKVVIGYPLDYTTTSALFPGLGEDASADTVPRFGQTFSVPAGHPYLAKMSVWLSDTPIFEPQPTNFDAVLMSYGADRPVGSVIHQSTGHNTAGLAHGERRRLDFAVGAKLDPLATYVFFLDAVPYLDGIPSYALFASDGDAYADGELVYSDIVTDLAHVSDNAWQPGGAGWDVIFRAEFNVPEPTNFSLLFVTGAALVSRVGRMPRRLIRAVQC